MQRRSWLQFVTFGAMGVSSSGWLEQIASAAQASNAGTRHCIVLWMSGGPSQLDTFDMKPDHANGGTFKESSTNVPGIRFSEHLPRLAQQADSLAILRGVSTKEGDHERGTLLMHTGQVPGGPVRYPAIGCSLGKSLAQDEADLPNYISIAPGPFSRQSISPGFLGPSHAPMTVESAPRGDDGGFAHLRVDFLQPSQAIVSQRHLQRLELWRSMQNEYLQHHPTANALAHDTVYQSAIRMLGSKASDAFDLSQEPDQLREAYGRGAFGQGCLMARRLVERGVPVVEVSLGDGLGWDTHADNFAQVRRLSDELDTGWANLMSELRDRGLLDQTTILWAGEFGRTPVINSNGGRDHFPQAFTCVLAGGGIAGGTVYGETSKDGSEVIDGKINQQDVLATLCQAVGVPPSTENIAEGGRPIAMAEGQVIHGVLR